MIDILRLLEAKTAKVPALAVFLLLFLALGTPLSGAQKTIRVPADQPSIQAGLDAANNGDTVLVSPGSYTEQLKFNGKAVTLTTGATSYSAPEVAATVINATTNAQGFTNPIASFFSNEGRGTVLNGFTLVSPTQAYLYEGSSPPIAVSVLNSLVSPPSTGPSPAGPGTPTITNNRFVGDATSIGLTGGVVASNYFGGGSGVYVLSVGSPNFQEDSDVHDNVIENNTLETQSVSNKPNLRPPFFIVGAILYASHALVYNNTIRNNTVTTLLAGGEHKYIFPGVGFRLDEPFIFAGNLVYGNQMDIQFSIALGADPGIQEILANNTIADNTPTSLCTQTCNPSQLLFTKSSPFAGNDVLVANNITRAGPGSGPTIACVDDSGGPYLPAMQDTLQVDHNLFAPSSQPVFDASCRQQIVNAGNLFADPGFAAPQNGNYRLLQGSPPVDAGNNSMLAQLSTFVDPQLAYSLTSDLDGEPRPTDATGRGYPILDMGAYELPATQNSPPTSLLLIPSTYAPVTTMQATLTANLSSALAVPTGSVTLTDNGQSRGTAVVQADGTAVFHVTQLTNGIDEFIATYLGNRTFPPAVSPKLVLPFEPIATTLLLVAGPATADVGAPVTLYVKSGAKDGTIPSPVTLTDNGAALGTVYPNLYGDASLVVTNFTPGTHTVVATYAGTVIYAAASATATVTINSNGFTIALNPPTIAVAAGRQGSTTVLLTSPGSFSGSLNLAAGAMPRYVSAVFSPQTVPLKAGATASAVLTLSTAASSTATAMGRLEGGSTAAEACAAVLALPLGWKRRRRGMGLTVLVASAVLMMASGCTTIRYALIPAAPGTYVIPITATDAGTHIPRSVNLTLVITP